MLFYDLFIYVFIFCYPSSLVIDYFGVFVVTPACLTCAPLLPFLTACLSLYSFSDWRQNVDEQKDEEVRRRLEERHCKRISVMMRPCMRLPRIRAYRLALANGPLGRRRHGSNRRHRLRRSFSFFVFYPLPNTQPRNKHGTLCEFFLPSSYARALNENTPTATVTTMQRAFSAIWKTNHFVS